MKMPPFYAKADNTLASKIVFWTLPRIRNKFGHAAPIDYNSN